ncbi:pyridoxamine 5'-phosphate oxidase [Acetobacter oeni]|uniref:Pyridoxine/pyridoxamine 5'-phosphate oxidase n=1 Tax=Acetobacter oeni TaxID=304077 RepID=A0A511XHH2_9PROT|nr:pyridoxamine 5'-phosphate oxidase [Acetobacter oeni]MBB3881246.1 pyridoxamine 5'-phosphate oxidase [Acetobacter oeni]NHO18121.1 pyridoxamine 5'-phosphate oxidase [Acetobacter oeni]GBR08231.1 pyridoxamine 5'-phosphate oxidase [Acetobacter oeni LMG 21952]GEN62398.1 pyridoxine/pyridoxamine 5'-phosphate oxidase [Acetobacter oeni]
MTAKASETVTSPLIDLSSDPFDLFHAWMKDAEASEPNDPNAMTLATVSPEGRPDARIVLLKGADRKGFTFFTNLESRKGLELEATPVAALLFHWKSLRRQIRIEGPVFPVTTQEADDYFASRRRMSQLGAIASDQSRPLPNRAVFEQRLEEVETEYAGRPVPRPANWSGFRVRPERFEFWQDRPYRLHDRAIWVMRGRHAWDVTRLYP